MKLQYVTALAVASILNLTVAAVGSAVIPGVPVSSGDSIRTTLAENPCASKNPCAAQAANCNPCASKNPCAGDKSAANPCASKNPCAAACADKENPCAGAK
ncbi:MAG: hypothetical protein HC835_14615 [Oscillatoriales cyanobacterium RM2_1_1]|nr:hypothetical protein [Oscillatoriales cyanobacterium SM2_3_0]NJO46751.1 hypothetical protein [Oscillatoriales cyanobacterium RM2_1_1]